MHQATRTTVTISGVSLALVKANFVLDELEEKSDRLGNEMENDLSEISSSIGTMEEVGSDGLAKPVVPYDFDNLPAHACAYCGIHDPCSVVKCVDDGKWFCNGKGTNEYGSHIILHLVKSKNKQIELHPQSELKDANLECHSCKGTNIFLLGFMPAKTEAYVILLCREPCLR